MEKKITLSQILEEHPEWKDYCIGVYCQDGHCDIVGVSGSVYKSSACYYKDDMESTLKYPEDAECVKSDDYNACDRCKYAYDIVQFSPN
jgi:hypothetical protein